MLTSDMGNKVQGMVENSTQQAAYYAHDDAEDTPANHKDGIILRTPEIFQPCHDQLSLLSEFLINLFYQIYSDLAMKTPSEK